MAIWIKWTAEQEVMWDEWLSERPQCIRDMVEKHGFRSDRLYLLKPTGQKVTIHAFCENDTVIVNVLYRFNKERMITPLQERRVFDIDPSDLQECDWDGDVVDGQAVLNGEYKNERIPDVDEIQRFFDMIDTQIESSRATKH